MEPNLIFSQNETVIKLDERERRDLGKKQYRPIGIVSVEFKDKSFPKPVFGTGTMISKNVVLTVAHNVYEIEQKLLDGGTKTHTATFDEVYFILGGENPNDEELNKKYKISYYFINERYKKRKTRNRSDDWALLVLQENIDNIYSFYKLKCFNTNTDQVYQKAEINGYPSDKLKKDKQKGVFIRELYGEEGKIEYHEEIWKYQISTYISQSGSPITIKQNGEIQIVGIHKG